MKIIGCNAMGCDEESIESMPVCEDHLRYVKPDTQQRLRDAFQPRQIETRVVSPEYQEAARQALLQIRRATWDGEPMVDEEAKDKRKGGRPSYRRFGNKKKL